MRNIKVKRRWLPAIVLAAAALGVAEAGGVGLWRQQARQLGLADDQGSPAGSRVNTVRTMGQVQALAEREGAGGEVEVPGLVAEYDPDDDATRTDDGADVTALEDKSGNDYHLDVVPTAPPGRLVVGGKTFLQFFGGQDLAANVASWPLTPPYTVYAVAWSADPAAFQTILAFTDKDDFNERRDLWFSGGTGGDPLLAYQQDDAGADQVTTSSGYEPYVVHLVTMIVHSEDDIEVILDGDQESKGQAACVRSPDGFDRWGLGSDCDVGPSAFLIGGIGLVRFYEGAHDVDTQELVQADYTTDGWWPGLTVETSLHVYRFSGDSSATGQFYRSALNTTTATSETTITVLTSWKVPVAGRIVALAWRVETDAATDPTFRVWGGAAFVDATVTGTSGRAVLNLRCAAGDRIAVEREAGDDPNDSGVWVYYQPDVPSFNVYFAHSGLTTVNHFTGTNQGPVAAGGGTTVPSALGQYVLPVDCDLIGLSYDTASADSTTDMEVWQGDEFGNDVETFELTGSAGVLPGTASFSAGDIVGLYLGAGTGPGAGNYVLAFAPSTGSGYPLIVAGDPTATGQFLRHDALPNASDTLVASDYRTEVPLGFAGTLDALTYLVTTGTTITTYKTFLNDVEQETDARGSGLRFGVMDLDTPGAAGDRAEWEYDADTDPGQGVYMGWVAFP